MTLVLDMDETLIHSYYDPSKASEHSIILERDNETAKVNSYIIKLIFHRFI